MNFHGPFDRVHVRNDKKSYVERSLKTTPSHTNQKVFVQRHDTYFQRAFVVLSV